MVTVADRYTPSVADTGIDVADRLAPDRVTASSRAPITAAPPRSSARKKRTKPIPTQLRLHPARVFLRACRDMLVTEVVIRQLRH